MQEEASIQAQAASLTTVLGDAVSAQPPSAARLPYAVIIPQRRPKKRERGFIRAYAPDLMRCGIDQATFLAFLDGFNAAIASSPWVGGLDLAGGAVGAIPASVTTVAPITGTAVQLVAGIYKEISARRRHVYSYLGSLFTVSPAADLDSTGSLLTISGFTLAKTLTSRR